MSWSVSGEHKSRSILLNIMQHGIAPSTHTFPAFSVSDEAAPA